MSKAKHPTKSLMQGFEYVPAAKTDVTKTWRRFGWLPKEEVESDRNAQAAVKRASRKDSTNA